MVTALRIPDKLPVPNPLITASIPLTMPPGPNILFVPPPAGVRGLGDLS